MTMSFKPEFRVAGDPKFYPNNCAFATKEEALANGDHKFCNWTMAAEYRVVESDQPVNYRWNFDKQLLEPV